MKLRYGLSKRQTYHCLPPTHSIVFNDRDVCGLISVFTSQLFDSVYMETAVSIHTPVCNFTKRITRNMKLSYVHLIVTPV